MFDEKTMDDILEQVRRAAYEGAKAAFGEIAVKSDKPLSTKEVCEMFDVSERTIRRRRLDGEIGFSTDFKGNYVYPIEEIEKFFARRTVYAVGASPKGNVVNFKKGKVA